jgi:hypothetical protein
MGAEMTARNSVGQDIDLTPATSKLDRVAVPLILIFSAMGATVGAAASHFSDGDVIKGAIWGGVVTIPVSFLIDSVIGGLIAAGAIGLYSGGGAKAAEGAIAAALTTAGWYVVVGPEGGDDA